MTEPLFTISNDTLELELSPSIGGAISNFNRLGESARTPILRGSNTPLEKILDAACFPLVPFVNRIRGGCFSFRGRTVRLSPNMAGDPSPLHGQGWTSAWRVGSAFESQVELIFEHQAGEWPWSYEARQHLRLDANALQLTLQCRNTSDEPMPCGLGFHPYFRCGPATRIETQVTDVWTVDDKVLPVARMPASGRYSVTDDPVCGRGLDNGYSDWSGRAVFSDPDWPFEIELSSPQARFFQVYSPAAGGLFVAEPVTHANAALNEPEEDWPALGIEVLEPGEEMALNARLEVRSKRSSLG
jgi:aldose 1-epimerase